MRKMEALPPVKLNLGCGQYPWQGWVNTDLVDEPGFAEPDYIADVLDLPFNDDCAELVYLGHVLEHLEREDVPVALAEVKRVLRPDGELMVVGPDLDRAKRMAPTMVRAIWPGAPGGGPGGHKWPSTEWETKLMLETAGFVTTVIPVATVEKKWPCPNRVGWQFAIEARP